MKTEIKSWLPVFPGFYNTLFDPDSQISEELREMGYDLHKSPECRNWDFWDNSSYELKAAQKCCEIIQGWLRGGSGIERVEFEKIVSPKEYNFSNDAVNAVYHVDLEKFTPWIRAFLKEHEGDWRAYLSRYKSRDGFMSFYSCDPAEWEVDTDGFARFERVENAGRVGRLFGEHAFGSLLEFYLRTVKDDPKMSLYYEATESFYIGDFINLPERSKA